MYTGTYQNVKDTSIVLRKYFSSSSESKEGTHIFSASNSITSHYVDSFERFPLKRRSIQEIGYQLGIQYSKKKVTSKKHEIKERC